VKFRDKTLPVRKVYFQNPQLVNNNRVKMVITYQINSNDTETYVRQPVEFDICQIRQLGGNFHSLLNNLEDRLRDAREHMKGTR